MQVGPAGAGRQIAIHGLRDNVATEASEHLPAGGHTATTLLEHKDEPVTRRRYDLPKASILHIYSI